MPAVSFYLSQEILDAVRAKAKAEKIPVSRIISDAVKQYLEFTENYEAKKRVLRYLTKNKPLGGVEAWEDLHRERNEADDGRG